MIAQVASTDEFSGWQTMRVIHQEGSPDRMLVADLDGDGRDQVIVVNARQSRLDLYRWLPTDKRAKAADVDPKRPNELPLAPEWSRSELPLDDLPADAIVCDLDGDKRPELLILTTPANKLLAYKQNAEHQWKKHEQWDLLAGTPTGKSRLMLLRPLGKDKHELLVSFEQGIQTLALEPGSRPSWLSPRENRTRLDWRLADLDGDGDLDVVEWSAQTRQTIRWFECVDGKLLPAQLLDEHAVQGFDVLTLGDKPAELLLLGGTQEGLLRRYQLARGDENELGRQESLPMPGGVKAAWCGILLDKKPALVAVDSSQPRLRVHPLNESGWQAEQSYPTIGNIRALAAPAAEPGRLLIWTKDAADLHASRWESDRLTYPQSMPQSADASDRRILALETVGTTTWWAQRVGADLDLYVWPVDAKEARKTRFAGVGTKTEKVVWLGGSRILAQQAYANAAKLIVLKDGKTAITEPAHLGKVDLAEFGLYSRGKELRPGRLVDGVLQWLGDDLQPSDQIMLADGQKLAAYVPLGDGQAWALEQGGAFMHRLTPDKSGIPRISLSIKPPHAAALRSDAVLGLILVDQDRVIRVSKGKPVELKLVDSIDSRIGRPSGVKEATIHRFQVTDVARAGQASVVLFDDRRHQLTVLNRTDDGLKSALSWQVFEDEAYPYGGRSESLATEPRLVLGFDGDGDGRRDLALLCHDRLVIYLAREVK
jgi:hypothetical protein